MMILFVEFLGTIQAAQVSVSPPSGIYSEDVQYLYVQERCIGTTGEKTDEQTSWDGPSNILPHSCLILNVDASNTLRLRFSTTTRVNSDSAQLHDTAESLFGAKCGFCCNQLTKSHLRVLPLPSTAWSELTGELFCHLHSHNGSSHHHHHQQEQEEEGEEDAGLGHTHHHAHHHMHLSPREGDCLLSDSSVILRTSALQLEDPNEALMLTPTLQLLCRRCRSHLGSKRSDKGITHEGSVLTLKRSKVILEHTCAPLQPAIVCGVHQLEMRLAKLVLSHCKEDMSFRFLVWNQRKHAVPLCVWVLSTRSTIVCNSSPRGASSLVDKFSGGCSCHNRSASSQCILKLLFKNPVNERQVIERWSRDASVEHLQFEEEDFLWLQLFLLDNHRSIPPSQRMANGFQVSFLSFH